MTSAVVDQGANILESDRVVNSTPGYNGTGVRVGILSDSFNTSGNGSYMADQVSGDLPGTSNTVGFTTPVNVLQDDPNSGGTDEGRAMLQIIHHVAPGATLGFATAFVSEAGFAQNITNLATPVSQGGAFGANVITDDVGYFDEHTLLPGRRRRAQAVTARSPPTASPTSPRRATSRTRPTIQPPSPSRPTLFSPATAPISTTLTPPAPRQAVSKSPSPRTPGLFSASSGTSRITQPAA